MTPYEWLTCQEPQRLLGFLLERGKLTERRCRLFGCACDRPANVSRGRAKVAAQRLRRELGGVNAAQCHLLRDIFFNPFRAKPAIPAAVRAWDDGCVVNLAAAIYEQRDFSHESVGVLGDALEEAGMTDEEVLGHCRQQGAHVRGCWLVDLLTARE
jgi:hypothetical protein